MIFFSLLDIQVDERNDHTESVLKASVPGFSLIYSSSLTKLRIQVLIYFFVSLYSWRQNCSPSQPENLHFMLKETKSNCRFGS